MRSPIWAAAAAAPVAAVLVAVATPVLAAQVQPAGSGPATSLPAPVPTAPAQTTPQLCTVAPGGPGCIDPWALLAQHVDGGAQWLLSPFAKVLQANTTSSGSFFDPLYRQMLEFMAPLAVIFLLLRVALGVVVAWKGGDASFLLESPWAVLVAFIIGASAVAITRLAIQVTDGMSELVIQTTGSNMTGLLSHLAATFGLAAAGTLAAGPDSIVVVIAGIAVILSVLGLLFELLIREAAMYICVLFIPLAAVARIWPPAGHLLRRLVEILAAVIVSKFAITVILILGALAFAASPVQTGDLGEPGMATILWGAACVVVAVIAPFALFRLLPMIEAQAMEGFSRHGRGAAQQAVYKTKDLHAGVMSRIKTWRAGGADQVALAGGAAAGVPLAGAAVQAAPKPDQVVRAAAGPSSGRQAPVVNTRHDQPPPPPTDADRPAEED